MTGRRLSLVVALLVAGTPAQAQVLCGTVVDTASNQPVAGVQVVVFSARGVRAGGAVTKADGEFLFRLTTFGVYRLQATRLGYATIITESIDVGSAAETRVMLPMVARPVSLDTLTVVARNLPPVEKRLPFLVDAGFYQRRRWGFGHFLTREDIEKRHPIIMADLLRDLPGVRITCTSAADCWVTTRGATAMFLGKVCRPSIVLDGVLVSPGGTGGSGKVGMDGPLNPFNIEAVEVYPGPAGVPVEFGGYVSPCGAIIAWSRR